MFLLCSTAEIAADPPPLIVAIYLVPSSPPVRRQPQPTDVPNQRFCNGTTATDQTLVMLVISYFGVPSNLAYPINFPAIVKLPFIL